MTTAAASPKTSLSRDVAEWAAALTYDDLSDDVRAAVRRHILDTLGIALASTSRPFGQRFRHWDVAPVDAGAWPGSGATALGLPGRYPPEHAALVNGVLTHGLDFDDTYQPGIVHIGTVVVPAALAMAEHLGRSSEEIVTAVAAGYELESRLGEAAPGAFHRGGWHATPICGAFAATLVASRLMKQSPDVTVAALGIVGSFAAGIQEFVREGADTKRLHPGWAALSGINAARLATIGFEGPAAVWEGHFGVYATHVGLDALTPERITAELGNRWNILRVSIKPYPCCHLMHAHIDAARALWEQGVRPEEVQSVTAAIHESGLHLLAEPVQAKRQPTTTYGAQFSLPYAVALGLTGEDVDLRSFSEERLADPRIRAVAKRVECVVDAESTYPKHFDGAVSVTLNDGRTLTQREAVNRGSPDRPLTDEDLRGKFLRNAMLAGLPASEAKDAEAAIREGGDVAATVARLNELLCQLTV